MQTNLEGRNCGVNKPFVTIQSTIVYLKRNIQKSGFLFDQHTNSTGVYIEIQHRKHTFSAKQAAGVGTTHLLMRQGTMCTGWQPITWHQDSLSSDAIAIAIWSLYFTATSAKLWF